MKALLFYDIAPTGASRLAANLPGHHARLQEFRARGAVLMAGPFGQPPTGALVVFNSVQAAEEFVAADPLVFNGVVTAHRIQPWSELLQPDTEPAPAASLL